LATASDVVGNKIKEGGKKSKPVQLYTPLSLYTLQGGHSMISC
jgi:hypothetical protein